MCVDPKEGDFVNLMDWVRSYMWKQIVIGKDPTYMICWVAGEWYLKNNLNRKGGKTHE